MRRVLGSLSRSWRLKLLALALAVLLWVVVSAEQITTTWVSLPFEVQENDLGFQLIEESVPPEVRVRFAGPGRAFVDLAIRRPPVLLRIGDVSDAEQVFEVLPSMVRLASGTNVEAFDVEPAFVRLRFRQLTSRDVPVRVVARGTSAEWAAAGPLDVEPSVIRIAGPAGLVANIDTLRTIPFALPTDDAPFSRSVPLDLTGHPGIEFPTRAVVVSGRLNQIGVVAIPDVNVVHPVGVAIRPMKADVRLRGPANLLAGARASMRVVLAIEGVPTDLPSTGISAPLRVDGLPSGVSATVTPNTVLLLPAELDLDSTAAPSEAVLDAETEP